MKTCRWRVCLTLCALLPALLLSACQSQEQTRLPEPALSATAPPTSSAALPEPSPTPLDADAGVKAVLSASAHPAVSSMEAFPYEYHALEMLSDGQIEVLERMREHVLALGPLRVEAAADGYEAMDDFMLAAFALSEDYPETDNYFLPGEQVEGDTTLAVYADYLCTWRQDSSRDIAEVRAGIDAFDQECDAILAAMPDGLSTCMRYFYLAEAVCRRAEYDYTMALPGVATPYGALVGGQAICQGYAKAFQALCQRAGLYCRMVSGASGGEGHAWNLVQLESGTYHIDLTWSDENHTTEDVEWLRYFMRTQQEILADHDIHDDTHATGTPLSLYPGD